MKKYQTILGCFFIVLAVVIIVVNLTGMAYLEIGEDGMDTNQYFLAVILNGVKYTVLSIFSFILGVKCLFKK